MAVCSAALGIGANLTKLGTIFSLIDTLLIKLLPVRDPQELLLLAGSGTKGTAGNVVLSSDV